MDRAAVGQDRAGLPGTASRGQRPATGLLRALAEDRLDPVALLLQAVQLGEVRLAGVLGLLLRVGTQVDEVRDLGLGVLGLLLEPLLGAQVLGRRLALLGHLDLGVLDLLLLHGEQGTGRLEPVEDDRLLVDDVLHGVELAGQLGGVLGGQHHRQAHQRRVAGLVVGDDDLAELLLLVRDLGAAGGQVLAGLGEPGDGRLELGLHLLVEDLGGGQLTAGLGQVRLRAVELDLRALERRDRLPGPGGRLVEVVLGTGDLALDLVLLVLQVVGDRERHRRHPQQQAAGEQRGQRARTGTTGEGAKHRSALIVRGK